MAARSGQSGGDLGSTARPWALRMSGGRRSPYSTHDLHNHLLGRLGPQAGACWQRRGMGTPTPTQSPGSPSQSLDVGPQRAACERLYPPPLTPSRERAMQSPGRQTWPAPRSEPEETPGQRRQVSPDVADDRKEFFPILVGSGAPCQPSARRGHGASSEPAGRRSFWGRLCRHSASSLALPRRAPQGPAADTPKPPPGQSR